MTLLSRSLQYYRRITANKVAPLDQLQTRLIYCNSFTIEASSYKSQYEKPLNEMTIGLKLGESKIPQNIYLDSLILITNT